MNQKGQFSAASPCLLPRGMASFDHRLATAAPFQPLVLAERGPELSACCYFPASPFHLGALGGGVPGRLEARSRLRGRGWWEQSVLGEEHFSLILFGLTSARW